ncbi:hypothetical protein FB45DRAFT_919356 [Roridomyces roridus]|uniref:Uncharacterized protein n=1 Tax=Roridomyces roridus TaxID=1738132 RepID=A0AAD7BRQ3_9AGAR|nr:hypothetical protein FB45DRAFT_919356 [Roridomyces roridus]
MGADIEYLRTEMLNWSNALSAYEAGDFQGALRLFEPISDTTKILMNMGLVYDRLGERQAAIESFTKAIELDKYLAIGYFQRGVVYFNAGQYAQAIQDFGETEKMMRTNDEINYAALGLDYRLSRPNILLNKYLALARLGQGHATESTAILSTLTALSSKKAGSADQCAIIDQALANPTSSTPCSTPAGTLYRPSLSRLQFLTAAVSSAPNSPTSAAMDPPPPAYYAAASRSNPTSSEPPTYLGGKRQKSKQGRKRRLSSTSRSSVDAKQQPRVPESVPTHTDLTRAVGPDLTLPIGTEILSTPCAGVRIAHGPLRGLMAWRFVVRRANSRERSSPRAEDASGVLVNFILDTGKETSYVPKEALVALGLKGDFTPGTSLSLMVQGIKTPCIVAQEGEAGRVGLGFMTAGSLTYYFDSGLVAPVLYDGSRERPEDAPRTIPPSASSIPWLLKLMQLVGFGRRHR